jgi:glutamate carboxypeptidase
MDHNGLTNRGQPPMLAQSLLEYLCSQESDMVATLELLVNHESPSREKAQLDALAERLAQRFAAIGCKVELIANVAGGNHVVAQFAAAENANVAPGLVLCHFDTVWPLGTVAARPFRVEGGRAYGPGTFDMKASLVLTEFALRAIRALDAKAPRPVHVLLTSDEEIGSPTSRALIESHARTSAYALVMESPLAGGRLKTARKSTGHFVIEVEGRAAHAGVEPEKGVSAIRELAHQIIEVEKLNNPATGTTVNVVLVEGGSASNVVPERAGAQIDVRVTTKDEGRRFQAAFESLKPVHPEAKLHLTGSFDRPPMERTASTTALFERARETGRSLDLELTEGSTGGASDGNLTAAVGTPTLDGLGALGAGAHAINEHIEVASLPVRATLLACLLLML